ncbi:outer dense fiber protein 3-like [Poecile atricapillus]|uniref:outer dense fiber protein 3-like n=1 Tax=Poecile atricapillus TaxID=48891 RepID=UPI00273843CD|nr:outer dense fiber protein 3-like [Poecile atricapillus]
MSHDSSVGPWRPHRSRVPVSVQFRTPGPKYRLPGGIGSEQRDPSSRRAPAYSFGRKLGRPEEPRSPGPQYLVPTGFTSRGRDRAPAFTMGRLPRERRVSSTPGLSAGSAAPPGQPHSPLAAQYHPELANRATLPSSPACVFIPRGRPDKPQETPGPASYELPPVMGPRLVTKRSAPQYSMAGRRRSLFDPRERGDVG